MSKKDDILGTLRYKGLPRWLNGKEYPCQSRRHQFNPWVGKIHWRRKWQPYSSILAWKISWTEEPGRLQSTGSQRIRHDWATEHERTHAHYKGYADIPHQNHSSIWEERIYRFLLKWFIHFCQHSTTSVLLSVSKVHLWKSRPVIW